MKKILLVFLTAALMLSCCAPASAAVDLPTGLTEIGDEAFMNAMLSPIVIIPDGVKTIGRRAFSGSSAGLFYLPPTLSSIAPDAFSKGATFEVLPDSYAREWCRENGLDYDLMRVPVSASAETLFPGDSVKITTDFPYPDRVSAFRWETSTDHLTWTTAAEGSETAYTVRYADREKLKNSSTLYIRCQALVHGVLLQAGNEIELSFLPDQLAFTENAKALNADSIYLEWTDMGSGTKYYVHQSVNGKWVNIAELTDATGFTVYGLEKDTLYRFTVVALRTDAGGRETKYETEDGIDLKTAATGSTTVQITNCQSYGTALNVEWDLLDRAVYDVAIGPAGGTMATYTTDATGNSASYYVLEPNTNYQVQVTARIPDSSLASGWHVFKSEVSSVTTGAADPVVVLEQPVVVGETVSLCWSSLPAVSYTVYMIGPDGTDQEIGSTENTYFDVGGLERSRQYSFRVEPSLGDWSSRSETVTVKIPAEKSDVEYRALLVGEVSFDGTQRAMRNYGDVESIARLLASAKTPTGGAYAFLRRQDLDKEDIFNEIRTAFGGADDNDVSLFFIATHGDIDEIGRNAGSLSTVNEAGITDTLRLEELADALSKVPGTVIVWLGSCGSGAAIYDENVPQNGDAALTAAAVAAFAAHDPTVVLDDTLAADFTVGETNAFERGEFRQPKFYVLTAARYHEMSWGMEDSRFNYFPKFICDGAAVDAKTGQMPADANQDGKLTQHELFSYIKIREEDASDFVNQNVQEYPLNSDYVLFVS